jgi:exopolysaccharide/PEP-CTERM locus tyrosine autokinase
VSIIEKAIDRLSQRADKAAASGAAGDVGAPPVSVLDEEGLVERLFEPGAAAGETPREIGSVLKPRTQKAEAPKETAVPTQEPTIRSREVRLNAEQMRACGMVVPGDAPSTLAEEFRRIKRPLLVNAFGKAGEPGPARNLIMVTSALPGEGKTFTSVNLALSMAMERDLRVLLVDADVVKSSVTRVLGIEFERGLIDLLMEPYAGIPDVLLRTDIDKLSVLPAGRDDPHATELLASEGMKRVAAELSQRYPDRVVIFDAPPLLASPGAQVVGALVHQIVLVVEAERTPQSDIKEALRLLDRSRLAGVVLNKSRQPVWAAFDYKYGYYKYGYGERGGKSSR